MSARRVRSLQEPHYQKHLLPDTQACIFWLRNRRPQQWRAQRHSSGRRKSTSNSCSRSSTPLANAGAEPARASSAARDPADRTAPPCLFACTDEDRTAELACPSDLSRRRGRLRRFRPNLSVIELHMSCCSVFIRQHCRRWQAKFRNQVIEFVCSIVELALAAIR